jgi:cell division protein FtsI/penicillin-binding protein 2
LYLTVDREIQTLAAQALADGVQRVKGKGGSAIVLDPRTGDVLALANYPEFNPNNVEKVPLDIRRNRAVSAVKPWSTPPRHSATARCCQQPCTTSTGLGHVATRDVSKPGKRRL